MSRAAIIKNINLGGISDSDYQTSNNAVSTMVGLDIHSTPGLIKVNQALVKDSGSTVTEFCKVGIACSNGKTYWFSGDSGKIWERDTAGIWTLVYTTSPASGEAKCLGAREYAGYIYWATQNQLHRIALAKVGNWTTGVELNWGSFNIEQEERGSTLDGYLLPSSISEDVIGHQSRNYGSTVSGSKAVGEANATGKRNVVMQTITRYGESMSSFNFYKDTDGGTFVGDVTFSIRNVVNETGTDYNPSTVDLVSLTITNAQWVQLPVGWNKIDFPYQFTPIVTPSTTDEDVPAPINVNRNIPTILGFIVTTSTSDNTNHIHLGYHTNAHDTVGRMAYWNVTDGWTHEEDSLDLTIDFNRENVNKMVFIAHETEQSAIGVNIRVVGTAPTVDNWIFTIHDTSNNTMATKTVAIADLVVGWNTITWTSAWTAELGKEYHLHITYST